jgi:predicted nucleic acid-binding protein
MILFFDTSALIKRYITETGSKKVDELFDAAESIVISPVTKIEIFSTINRLFMEKVISEKNYELLKSNIDYDIKYFEALSLSKKLQERAIKLVEKHRLKTLDSIQLAACLHRREIWSFIVSDLKLKRAAQAESLEVIDPADFE